MSESIDRKTKTGGAIRTMLITTGTLLGVVVFSLFGVGGSYAYLNSSATGNGAVLQAGTAALSISGGVSVTGLYPGDSRQGTFTITNNGNVPLGLHVAAGSDTVSRLSSSVAAGSCPAVGIASGAVATGSIGVVLAPGASTSACLVISMATDAPASAASKTIELAVQFTGVQQ